MRFLTWLVMLMTVWCTVGAAQYTVAFKSFAPNNTDIFIGDRDGNVRPLAPDSALDYNASFSADGQWIVWTSHRSGNADIYRIHADGSGLERLTDAPGFDDQGALSPDGRSLAFVSSRGGQADIWILDLATRKARNLTSHPAGDFRPDWSPDGRRIAFSSDRGPARGACPDPSRPGPGPFVTRQYPAVYIIDADGKNVRRISDSTEIAGTPHWSPDGTRLAFYVGDTAQVCDGGGPARGIGTTQIVTVELGTGVRATLTSGPGLKACPRWTNGSEVAYQTADSIRFANGSAGIAGEYQCPDWSSDGRTMVFHRERDPRDDRDRDLQRWSSPDARFALLRVPDGASFSPTGDRMVYMLTSFSGPIRSGTLILANADGSGRRAIYEGSLSQDATPPAWSPRGDAIAFGVGGFFQRSQFKPSQIMRVNPEGVPLAPLTNGEDNSGMPSWSPDGRQVVYRVARGSLRNLYILDVQTGERRKLETGSDYDTFPTWSPAGDWIAFTSKRDGDYEIYRIRPDGTGLERLTRSPGNDAHPAFSPDGAWIAFATARQGFKDEAMGLLLVSTFQPYGEIAVMRADGSDVHVLTDNGTEEGWPSWVPQHKR